VNVLVDGAGQLGGLAQVLEGATPAALAGAVDEDIHSWVEARLTERTGDPAGQAHLGRSRNEQSVTALRVWIRGAIAALRADTARLVRALAEKGTSGADAVNRPLPRAALVPGAN